MAILKIARMGHPVLLRRADPVEDPTAPEIHRLIDDMIETMMDASGVGLAAPQVHVSLRLFVFRLPSAPADQDSLAPDDRQTGETGPGPGPHVLMNPEVVPLGPEMALGWEGCLSIPGLQAAVPRHARIRYSGLGRQGELIERVAEGRHGVIVQHENDHLDGVLYTMRMSDFSLMGFNEEVARYQPMLPPES
jgi:peptide deformylase